MNDIDVECQWEDDGRRNEHVECVEDRFEDDVPFGGRALMEWACLEEFDQLIVRPRSDENDRETCQTQDPLEWEEKQCTRPRIGLSVAKLEMNLITDGQIRQLVWDRGERRCRQCRHWELSIEVWCASLLTRW